MLIRIVFLYLILVNWLPNGKTLRQCGIEESNILILRRKYFFSDQNIDKRDPVQLNLLYIQVI